MEYVNFYIKIEHQLIFKMFKSESIKMICVLKLILNNSVHQNLLYMWTLQQSLFTFTVEPGSTLASVEVPGLKKEYTETIKNRKK